VIFIANTGLELRDKCGQGNMTVVTMKIGIVISGGDVSGINNFIFQIAKLASADITFLMVEYRLLDKNHQEIAWRDLVDFSICSLPVITSGRTTRKLLRSEYETIAKKLNRCVLMCSLWPAAMAACSFSIR
jgi:6-phosphofructokinase